MKIADRIEQTLLRPDSSEDEVRLAVMAASRSLLAAIVVPPVWARFAVTAASASPVRVCVSVGYPLGTHTASAKGLEARLALEEGATEVLFVPNLTAFKSDHRETFRQDVAYVVKQCRQVNPDALVKVLLYSDLLRADELREVVHIVQGNGGRFIMLGAYAPQPIAPTLVQQLQAFVVPESPVGVLSAVRSAEEARPLLALGIARLATPWGVEVAREAEGK